MKIIVVFSASKLKLKVDEALLEPWEAPLQARTQVFGREVFEDAQGSSLVRSWVCPFIKDVGNHGHGGVGRRHQQGENYLGGVGIIRNNTKLKYEE